VARAHRRERRRGRRTRRRRSRFRRPARSRGYRRREVLADALVRQCRSLQDELDFLAPWSALAAAPSGLGDLTDSGAIPTLRELAVLEDTLQPAIEHRRRADAPPSDRAWLDHFRRAIAESSRRASERMLEIDGLASQCEALADMAYDFLYDGSRHLLAIGYNVDERRRDPSYYDLLASEARLASSSRLPRVGCRRRTGSRSGACSPPREANRAPLVERLDVRVPDAAAGDAAYDNTLLEQTYRATVARQIAYGKQRGVPWESRRAATTRSTPASITNTAPSACPAWG